MPGDEVHEEAVPSAREASDAGRERIGPRHAAPRKPLLNRLHVPAGKAIAMAAMPSAVLMGMGLTPQLASAKPLPKNPFKGGSCVSQPDKDENAEEKAKEKAAKEKAEREKAEQEKEKEKDEQAGGSESSEPEPSPSESSPSGDSGGSDGSGGTGGSEDPEPSPSPSEPGEDEEDEDDGGLLGGVGDAIGDILTPEEKKAKEAEEKEEEEKAAADSSDSGSVSSPVESDKPVGDALGKVGDGLKNTTDKLGETVGEAGKGATDKLPSAGGDEAGKGAAGKNGKAFPCVEEKKSAGKDEQTPNTLPNDPWTLKASSLGLHGLDYEGVVNIRTQDGKTKQALKFTANSVDIGDLHQIVKGPDGTNYHVQAAQGSTSTIRGGKVTMYTEKLKGNLFGLIPIVFDPKHPPPLNVPEAYFTNVEVTQAGQFGGNLTVPGLHQSID